MKKVMCLLMVNLMLFGLAAGSVSETAAEADDRPLAERIAVDPDVSYELDVMTWHHTEVRRSLVDQTIALLNEKYPNITVNHNPVEDYTSAYKLAFDSGDPPDIIYVDDTNQNLLTRYDYLMDIADIAELKGWYDKAKPGAIEYQNRRSPGEIYSVPHASAPRVVWYNKQIFEELGLEIPVTFDEFNAVLAKIKNAGYIPFEASTLTMLWHTDGLLFGQVPIEDITKWYYLEETTPAMRAGQLAALKQVEEWVKNGYFREGLAAVDHNSLNVLFGRGETAIYISGASAAKPLNQAGLDVGAFAFPKKSRDFQTTLVDAADSGWAIAASLPDEKLPAAVAFIDTFFTQEATKVWVEGGFVTTMTFPTPDAKIFPQQMEALNATEGAQMGYFLDNAAPGLFNTMQILNARLAMGEIDAEGYLERLTDEYETLKAEALARQN